MTDDGTLKALNIVEQAAVHGKSYIEVIEVSFPEYLVGKYQKHTKSDNTK